MRIVSKRISDVGDVPVVRLSIGTKLTIVFLVLAIIPMSSVTYYNLTHGRNEVTNLAKRELIGLSRSTAYSIEQMLIENQRNSAMLAGDPLTKQFLSASVKDRRTLSPKIHKMLKNFVDTHPDYDSPGLLDANGIVMAALDETLVGKDRSFRDYFQTSIKGRPYISDILVGRATGRPGVFLTNPIISVEGNIIGIVILWLKADTIWEIIDDVKVGKEGIAYLVNQDSVIIAHPNRELLYQSLGSLRSETLSTISKTKQFGTIKDTKNPVVPKNLGMDKLAVQIASAQVPSTYHYSSPQNHRYHQVGYSRLKKRPWTVVVDLPEDQFLAPLNRMRTVAYISIGMVTLITILISVLLARSITRPIRRLAEVSIDVEYDRSFSLSNIEDLLMGNDEIAHLGRVFSSMVKYLRESKEKFRGLVESSSDWIWEANAEGFYTYASPQIEAILGYKSEEVVGKKPFDLMPLEEAIRIAEIFKDRLENSEPIVALENVNLHKDGRQIVLETSGVPVLDEIGKVVGFRGIDRDITERKRAEDALRESEEKYRELVEASNDVIFSMNMDGCFTFISRAIEVITGFTPQEVLGSPFHQFIHPDDLPMLQEHFRQVITGDGKGIEYRIINKTGKILWVSSHSSAIYHGNKAVGFNGKTTNINERKEAEKDLRESEFFFSQMFEQSSTATCLYDPNGLILRVNPEFCKMFGVDEKVITNGTYNVFEDQAAKSAGIIPLMKRVFENKQTNKWEFSFDINLSSNSTGTPTLKTGIIYLDVFGYPILDDDRELKYVVLQYYDITEKKKTQELLIQNEKMMSVGGLAAGMAHELNNPLGGIIQGTQNVLRRFSPDLKSNLTLAKESGIDLENLQQYMEKRGIHSFLNGILNSGKKASQIILSMVQFSRQSEFKMTSVNLVNLIEDTLELAGKNYNLKKKHDFRTIDIVKDFDSDLPLVPCTATEIEQVILNLLNNAAWAMSSDKGVDQPQINLRIKTEKEMVCIEVEDNGPGMDEETRKRVFEPFFTTKPVGEGTGLGLSVSYMIITNNHQGTMEVESEPGKGTNFIIRLPLDRDSVS